MHTWLLQGTEINTQYWMMLKHGCTELHKHDNILLLEALKNHSIVIQVNILRGIMKYLESWSF